MLDFICMGSAKLIGIGWERKIQNVNILSQAGFEAKMRKYRGIFEVHSPEKKRTSSRKGLVSTSRTYASPKWDGTRCLE